MFSMRTNLLLPNTKHRDVIGRVLPALIGRLLLLDGQQVRIGDDDLFGRPALRLLLQGVQFLLVGPAQQALAGPMVVESVELLLDLN